jgi:SAM-dependent methyltransferase
MERIVETKMTMDEYRQANLELWNEWVEINARSEMYALDQFKMGKNALHSLEIGEVGEVGGKTLLHLQCHFGMDTLSWARLGAQVTGIDFSDGGIRLASSLSRDLGIPARFLCCDLYDLPKHLDEQFDIVFTSYGALTWLSDLKGWAQVAARYVKPGGVFYIAEIHPFAMVFDETTPELRLRYPYFDVGVMEFEVQGSYADPSAHTNSRVSYEWSYPLGTVVTSLIEAGLQIEFLHEFPYAVYPMYPFLEEDGEGHWYLPGKAQTLPLTFSLRAHKPA